MLNDKWLLSGLGWLYRCTAACGKQGTISCVREHRIFVGITVGDSAADMSLTSLASDALIHLSDPIVSLALGIVLLCLFLVIWLRENRNLPPGPTSLPYLGYLPAAYAENPLGLYRKLQDKYGDVFCFKIMGGHRIVVFNSYETVREAFIKQGDNVTALAEGFSIIRWLLKYSGLEGQHGVMWREQRRYTLQTLRDFGFGKSSLEGEIQENTEEMVQEIHKHAREPYDFAAAMAQAAGNVVAKLLFNKKLDMNDSLLAVIRKNTEKLFSNLPGLDALRPMALYGRLVPLHWYPQYRKFPKLRDEIFKELDQVIEEHARTLDPDNPRDFIDMFLIKSNGVQPGTVEAAVFDRSQLAPLCFNLWTGGISTTSDSVNWAIKLLAMHPDIQRKVQMEIDDVIGRERLPSYPDNQKTPYTCATIFETMRIASLVGLTELLRNYEEMTIAGYRIPKNTLLQGNLYAVHHDPQKWKNPHNFDPGNFLAADGKVRQETLMAFFVGKRSCPGESLARISLYIMLARLLQKFTFTLPEDEDRSLEPTGPILRILKPFRAIATPRM